MARRQRGSARTVAASTPGSRSISRARSIAIFRGDCQVVTMAWLGAMSRSLVWAIASRVPRCMDATRIWSALAPVGHVDVRVFLVPNVRIDARHHLVRQVGVQVEGRHDRHARSNHIADRPDQEGFAVVVVLQRHSPVENEQDAVDRVARRGSRSRSRLARRRTPQRDRPAGMTEPVGRRDQLHTSRLASATAPP